MTAAEARRRAIDHLEREGFVVYTQMARGGLPMMGQLVAVWPANGRAWLVRVITGSRPPRAKRLIVNRRRAGLCDLIAAVDPRDASVRLLPRANAT